MDKATNPREWIQQAKVEIDIAEHLFTQYYPKPLEIICFHAQQTAEKSVKAVLLRQSKVTGVIKSHDISLLLDYVDRENFPFSEVFHEYADELFPYGVIIRYPSQLQNNIDESRTGRAIRIAKEIWQWANEAVYSEPKASP